MDKNLLVKKQGKFIPGLTLKIPASGIVSVGSDASATVELEGDSVAPEQFVIVCEYNQMTLLCRVDNTKINGSSLAQGSLHNLEIHDTIVVGDYSLILETDETAEKLLSGEIAEPAAVNHTVEPERQEEMFSPLPEDSLPSASERQFEITPLGEQSRDQDKSLSEVLEGLRSEEKFYFLIENGVEEKRRVYVETEELWLGWGAAGECVISENQNDITQPRAQIRKDWSGVVLYPLKNKNIWLNKQVLDEPHRLKNDDSLQLLSKDKYFPDAKTNIKFHEPTALLVLDSILPKELPPPVLLEKTKSPDLIHETQSPGKTGLKKQSAVKKRKIFGYFTALEVFIMIVGILVAASLIFLVLEYF